MYHNGKTYILTKLFLNFNASYSKQFRRIPHNILVFNCRGPYCTLGNSSPFVAFYTDPPPPILAKCGNHHYQQNFHCHFHPTIHESTLHQALQTTVWRNTAYHSIQFSLNTIRWDNQPFYFIQGWYDFPGRSFIITYPLYENLEKYPPSANMTPLPLSTKSTKVEFPDYSLTSL